MEPGILIAFVGSTVTIVGVMISLMFWMRSEANQSKERKDFLHLIRNIENSINEIKSENKDFHCRLLEIEKSIKIS